MKREKIFNGFLYIILISVALITMLPIVYTICASFKTNAEILASPETLLPASFNLDNYNAIWTDVSFNLPKLLFNSSYYSIFVVVITLILSSMAGYVFARGDGFPGQKIIFTVFSSLMFISLGSITIYPTFDVLNIFGLSRSLWGLIVLKFFSIDIVNIYLVRSYIRTLPVELDQAAEVDGVSFIGIFFRIIFPLLKPILATIGLLAFQASWNDYLMPTMFTLTRPDQQTLIVWIASLKNSGMAASSWNLMMAGAVISLLPVLLAYVFASKYFVSGIIAGSVKG